MFSTMALGSWNTVAKNGYWVPSPTSNQDSVLARFPGSSFPFLLDKVSRGALHSRKSQGSGDHRIRGWGDKDSD